jgi:hypothetical protein
MSGQHGEHQARVPLVPLAQPASSHQRSRRRSWLSDRSESTTAGEGRELHMAGLTGARRSGQR